MSTNDDSPIVFTHDAGEPCAICLTTEKDVASLVLAAIDNRLNVCATHWAAGPQTAAVRLRALHGEVNGEEWAPLAAFAQTLEATANYLEGLDTWPV